MNSRGSVIPLFIDQLRNNRPLTMTDPNMTRFMMSLEDAVRLVFFCFSTWKKWRYFCPKVFSSNNKNISTIYFRTGKKKLIIR